MILRLRGFINDIEAHTAFTGLLVAVVGYASSVAIVIQGLRAVGATTAEIASALFIVSLAKGFVAIALSLHTRMPISIAWTTPGMALFVSVGTINGGFATAIGACVLAGLAIALAGFWPRLGSLVRAIPRSIANAMLAGILMKFCLAPFVALKSVPIIAGLIIVTWLLCLRFARRLAAPVAVAVALIATLSTAPSGTYADVLTAPGLVFITPHFSLESAISLAFPLFLVTMAAQNITGLTVLSTFGYHPGTLLPFAATGLASAIIAPFGGPTINLAAITAALAAGPDAHSNPDRRYVAGVFSGVGYLLLAGIAGITSALVTRAPPILIEAVAGLALVGAFTSAIRDALEDETQRLAACVTFLTAASGLSLGGISAAFWGLVFGLIVLAIERLNTRPSV